MTRTQCSQTASWRRKAFQSKNGHKAEKKKIVALFVSTNVTDSWGPKTLSFSFFLSLFLILWTYRGRGSAEQAVLLRWAKEQEMKKSAVLSAGVETSSFCYGLRMPSAQKWLSSKPYVLCSFRVNYSKLLLQMTWPDRDGFLVKDCFEASSECVNASRACEQGNFC